MDMPEGLKRYLQGLKVAIILDNPARTYLSKGEKVVRDNAFLGGTLDNASCQDGSLSRTDIKASLHLLKASSREAS